MNDLERNLRMIILDNQDSITNQGYIPRRLQVEHIPRKATIITGIRRCGKSIYQLLYMQELLAQGTAKENFCIIDFSDDRLFGFRTMEPGLVSEVYFDLFPEKTAEKIYFFFDEIQYLHHWELFVNRLQRTLDCEINITGSSAKLLIKEISTEYGGRSLAWELFPFSFAEYITLKQDQRELPRPELISSTDIHFYRSWFSEYMEVGGMPEAAQMQEKQTRIRYLQNLADAVVFRDVLQRYGLKHASEVRRLMQMCLNQMSGLASFTKLKQRMAGERYKMSIAMIGQVIRYFEDAYLLYSVEIFSMNTAVRATNPKKIYCADHALALSVTDRLTPDKGKILENIVFIHLRHETDQIYYGKTKSGKEIDFITVSRTETVEDRMAVSLYQVCYEMGETETRERETTALWEAMEEYGIDSSVIITSNTEESLERGAYRIEVVPAWRFLLESQ